MIVLIEVLRLLAQQIFTSHRQPVGGLVASLLPPTLKGSSRDHIDGNSGQVVAVDILFIGGQLRAARQLGLCLELLNQCAVRPIESLLRVPLTKDQCVTDKKLSTNSQVDS